MALQRTLIENPNKIPYIAVMGKTGVGKSSFINHISPSGLAPVGHEEESCTQKTQDYLCNLGGRLCVILDTPGFDDQERSDVEILKMIAEYLAGTYQQGRKLTALFYLIEVTQKRMGKIAQQHLKLFHELCGQESLTNVIIVFTMCDNVSEAVVQDKEDRMKSKYLKDMIAHGARTARLNNSADTAQAIMRLVIDQEPITTRIQKETVDEGKKLGETSAGKVMANAMSERIDELKEVNDSEAEIARLREELENLKSHDPTKPGRWTQLALNAAEHILIKAIESWPYGWDDTLELLACLIDASL